MDAYTPIGEHFRPPKVPMSDETRAEHNRILETVLDHLECQCVGSVKSWIGGPNPVFTVVHRRGPASSAPLTFTAQVIDPAPTLTFPLDHPRIADFFQTTHPEARDRYHALAREVNGPNQQQTLYVRVPYTSPSGQPYKLYFKYVIKGMEKHIVFTPAQDFFGTPADPALHMAKILDLILGTSIVDSIVNERSNPPHLLVQPRAAA